MKVTKIYQDGSLLDAAVLDLSTDSILAKFKNAISLQAKIALGVGVPTTTSAPHSILNAFKNLVAVSAYTGYVFPEAKSIFDTAKAAAPIDPIVNDEIQNVLVAEVEPEVTGLGNIFGMDSDEEEY